jgi:hypothetical protein
MNLIDLNKQFPNEDACYDYLEQMRWPDGVRCLTCGNSKVSRIRSKSKKQAVRRIYQCLEPTCKQQFTATAGTIFHDTHLPLKTWFMAIALVCNAKKGLSALQLQRDLGLGSYRSAWYLMHRIRESMKEAWPTKLTGEIEIDETYIGGKAKRRGPRKPKPPKDMVLGMVERGGRVRYFHIPNGKLNTLKPLLDKHIRTDVRRIVTDEAVVYDFALDKDFKKKHRTVNHSREYVSADGTHTNTIESAFSLLKRGLIGSFHRVSIKHLHRYLSEFEYRFNRRGIAVIFEDTVRRVAGIGPMPYRKLIAEPSES